MDRREVLHTLVGTAAMAAAVGATRTAEAHTPKERSEKIRYCLNMSTIQDKGQKIDVQEQIRIAAKAGYTGVELWLRDIQKYTEGGGKLDVLRRQIADAGLTVDSAIAFGKWLVDDESTRKKGLEECARDMNIIRELGGRRIAAPPTGMTDQPLMNLDVAGERYRALLELGRSHECTPQIEVWGFSQNCFSLEQVLYICAAANHPDACILPDVYHLYKGGSDFSELSMLAGPKVHVFHMNDYPAVPPRTDIKDEHRVYPGDGIAPLGNILRTMVDNGFTGSLSLELFNREYWQQDPQHVASTGLVKMKAAVATAFA
jgi:2-keto-myo-inositol isomerase